MSVIFFVADLYPSHLHEIRSPIVTPRTDRSGHDPLPLHNCQNQRLKERRVYGPARSHIGDRVQILNRGNHGNDQGQNRRVFRPWAPNKHCHQNLRNGDLGVIHVQNVLQNHHHDRKSTRGHLVNRRRSVRGHEANHHLGTNRKNIRIPSQRKSLPLNINRSRDRKRMRQNRRGRLRHPRSHRRRSQNS